MLRKLVSMAMIAAVLVSCSDDDEGTDPNPDTTIEIPATYVFQRDGESTVSFGGQTTRLLMANQILSALKDETATEAKIDAMYNHQEGAADFSEADLNSSDKQVRNKTAGSYFFKQVAPSAASIGVKAVFDGFIAAQVADVFPNWNTVATAGNAGQLPDGSSTRYVNRKGLELDQAFNKGLIGAFVTDQILNNYTNPNLLAQFEEANNMGTIVEGKSYTDMEHDWDEAYGYAFGVVANTANPVADVDALDANDKFLAKYIKRVENDPSFTGIAQRIFDAFKAGRTAIVNKDYDERNAQADVLRTEIAKVIAVRAVHYLQAGKGKIGGAEPGDMFHDLSEGYGFVYSLQFLRKPGNAAASFYFSSAEVTGFLDDIYNNPTNGFWGVTAADLDAVSEAIAAKFDFTVAEAADSKN